MSLWCSTEPGAMTPHVLVKMCETGSGLVAGTSVDKRHHSGGAQHAERRNANLNR